MTLHKSTVWAITTSRAIFDIKKTVFTKSHYKTDYNTITSDDDDARYLTYSMKNVTADNDHSVSITQHDGTSQIIAAATFDISVACSKDNFKLMFNHHSSGGYLSIVTHDGTKQTIVW